MSAPTLRLEIVTAEKLTYADDVNAVIAPGVEGELGILPHHARLMTILKPGELTIKKGAEETYLAIGGGFLEVRPDKVIVLADAAERADDIDLARAEEARKRAEEALKIKGTPEDLAQAEAALRRALTRIKVAQHRRQRQPTPPPA
jgi:F-type H+-transporting ATPase subunit epsilon